MYGVRIVIFFPHLGYPLTRNFPENGKAVLRYCGVQGNHSPAGGV